ncbi:MAG: exopolyphosphatase, partial [Gammaproteobacteria bacterium]
SLLSVLVRLHRRKIALDIIKEETDEVKSKLIKLVIILRLAIVLNRSRNTVKTPCINIKTKNKEIELEFQEGWLNDHPLTEADLETEANYLTTTKYTLNYK